MPPPCPSLGLSLLLVGGDEAFVGPARAAHELAFPGDPIVATRTIDEALAAETGAGLQLAVLADPDAAGLQRAVAALDEAGLPRWGVIARSDREHDDRSETVAPADWSARFVAQAFRSMLARHRLRRENAQLHDDLRSIGTRVAHDLRSPLGGVLTSADLLKEVLAEEAPASVPLVEPVIESVDGLMKLIRQLSLVAKASPEANARTRVNMGVAIWSASQKLERRMIQRGADYKPAETWPDVIGDAAWLEAVWYQLLSNALEHGGEPARIEAGWDRSGDTLRFWVRDDGTVPLEKRAALFPRFHQLHQPNAPRGLGLAIVRRLVELLGGQCGYEPIEDHGSRFSFTLPAVK